MAKAALTSMTKVVMGHNPVRRQMERPGEQEKNEAADPNGRRLPTGGLQ
jgi:hypothetical protein